MIWQIMTENELTKKFLLNRYDSQNKLWPYLVPDDPEFFLGDSRLRLRVQMLSPSVEVIEVEEAGVSPRLFVKLKIKRINIDHELKVNVYLNEFKVKAQKIIYVAFFLS
jgi:hypothetical protein